MFIKKKANKSNLIELRDEDKKLLIQVLKKEFESLVKLLHEENVQNNLDLYLSVNSRINHCDNLIDKFNC